MAETSSGAGGCTTATNEHEILIQNETLKMTGLDEDPRGTVPDQDARRILKELIGTLMKQGDIHLIMYCVRGERVIQTLRRNYEFIHSQVKRRVPIVLVVTCLESYEPEMEEWWRVNERTISDVGMTFAGHACVTTAMMVESRVVERRNQSCDAVRKLIIENKAGVHARWLPGAIHNVPSTMVARSKHTNIVLFGQAGAGKSSLVNLMAEKDIAGTSNGMQLCTLRWQEYSIKIDGESYKVFDTVGLEEPQLGIPQYLDAVENSYKLIQDLERQGGIDLLIFCMRAGRLTTTLQTNYRLFYEFLCDKKVPIVVVITYLENEVGEMDAWWDRNEEIFHEREVHVDGHACITAIKGNSHHRHEESRTMIRDLVEKFTANEQKQAWKGGNNLFVSFTRNLRELLVGNKKPARKNMVFRLTSCGMSPDVAKRLAGRIMR
ncbi:P-loop containing nucleoside triphosphate hydrolase protein [Suillus lakei]|nr:P-loop containing nucleoside triphosphate hydrolase protein [Suillus lakei]